MRDKDGVVIRCKHSDWRMIDDSENQDYVCVRFKTTGYHECYGDELCRFYEPKGVKNEQR